MRKPRKKKAFLPVLGELDFFDLIATRANYLNHDVVEEVYYEMVRTMLFLLRTKMIVRLPDFGDFRVILHDAHQMIDYRTKEVRMVPPLFTVKFIPSKQLKIFFRQFDGDPEKMAKVKEKKR